MESEKLFAAQYTLLWLSLAIAVADLYNALGLEVVATVSRVSIAFRGFPGFSASPWLDTVLVFSLSSASLLGLYMLTRNMFYLYTLFTLSALYTVSIAIGSLALALSFHVAVSLVAVLRGFAEKRLKTVVEALLYAASAIEIYTIAYLLCKPITGFYPPTPQIIYLNLSLLYIAWPLVVASTAFASTALLLRLFRLFPREIDNRLKSFCSADTGWEGLTKRDAIYIALSASLAVSLNILLYTKPLNPFSKPINVDWVYYYNWLRSMVEGDMSTPLKVSDRPLYIAILYLVWLATRIDPKTIAIYHNIALLALYTASMYIFAKRFFGEGVAHVTAFIAPLSPQTISFVYGGFQANLLALSLTLAALAMVFSRSRWARVAGYTLLATTMLVHEWTWAMYTSILLAYAVISLVKRERVSEARNIVIYTAITLAIDLAKHFLGLFSALNIASNPSLYSYEKSYAESLRFYINIFTGGSLNNPAIYLFAAASALCTQNQLLAAVYAPPLAMFTVLPNGFSYRALVNTPLAPLAAYTITKLSKEKKVLAILTVAGIGMLKLYSIVPDLPLS